MSKTIIGLITVLLAQFVPAEEIETVMVAVGILLSWYARYSTGDITLFGARK
jgi:hypothetical protein